MNRDYLRKNLTALVANVLPKNARQIRNSFFENQPTNTPVSRGSGFPLDTLFVSKAPHRQIPGLFFVRSKMHELLPLASAAAGLYILKSKQLGLDQRFFKCIGSHHPINRCMETPAAPPRCKRAALPSSAVK
jgi:hypothetical protein